MPSSRLTGFSRANEFDKHTSPWADFLGNLHGVSVDAIRPPLGCGRTLKLLPEHHVGDGSWVGNCGPVRFFCDAGIIDQFDGPAMDSLVDLELYGVARYCDR